MEPVRESAEIFAVQRVGAYTQFTVIAPAIAAGFVPGHVVAIAVGGSDSAMLLRRVVAISDATASESYAGTVQFVVDGDAGSRDAGARWLARRRVGEALDLIGPLGTSFPLPSGPAAAVLVGAGHLAAPLVPLARSLIANGSAVEIVLGATTATRLYGETAAKRVSGQVTVTTDDGTAGTHGPVTDPLPGAIARTGAEIIYASGPVPMLRAVGAIARRHAIHARVALDIGVGCGIGICASCVVGARGLSGASANVRCCVEGPVFDADRLQWDEIAGAKDALTWLA